jgi:8-oxo-dGTP pyrophosphatase MutT (NUDIX family)
MRIFRFEDKIIGPNSPYPNLDFALLPIAFNETLRSAISERLQQWSVAPQESLALKRAAVTVIITDAGDGTAALILTLRSRGLNNHAGQYALPGGRLDPGETAQQAALREMQEEIGLHLAPEAILGQLDDYPTRSGYLITPLVAWADADAPMVANPDEVAAIFRIPLQDLGKPGSPEFVTIPESDRPVIRYPLMGRLIHAPTAAIMYQFMEVALFERATRVAHLEQAVFAWR